MRMLEVIHFRCPSDVANTQPSSGGAVNYYPNKGTSLLWSDTGANGVIYRGSDNRIADITDGTSHTAAFSERLLTDGSNGISTPHRDVYLAGGDPTTQNQAVQMCNAVDANNLANQFPVFMGAPWIDGQHGYQHVNVPNARSCGFFPTKATMPPSSMHPGGVHMLLCDGSARFVSENVNLQTWRAIGTRAGGETVSDY
jgi:prepilin-type processing-associated H-X9-DG protein